MQKINSLKSEFFIYFFYTIFLISRKKCHKCHDRSLPIKSKNISKESTKSLRNNDTQLWWHTTSVEMRNLQMTLSSTGETWHSMTISMRSLDGIKISWAILMMKAARMTNHGIEKQQFFKIVQKISAPFLLKEIRVFHEQILPWLEIRKHKTHQNLQYFLP